MLIVALANPASGPLVSSPLTGTINFDTVAASVRNLPDSSSTVLHVGQSHTAAITITNGSSVPQAYFLDARLNSTTTETLTPLTAATNVSLPLGTSAPSRSGSSRPTLRR